MKQILNYIKKSKKHIIIIFGITFICGLITHGYMFFNNNLTHDSFVESIATQNIIDWKISLGRVFYAPYIHLTRGILALPWLIGVLSLIFISISSILLLRLFKIKEDNHWLNILIPLILTANNTVIALCGSYIHDMDIDMFALLMSILSVYLWRNLKKGYLYGIIPLLLVLGLYQSYISVTLSLIIFLLILDLLNKEDYQKVLKKGLQSILMIVVTGVIYWGLLKLTPIIFNVSLTSGNYNSIDSILSMSFAKIIKETIFSYLSSIKNFLLPVSIYNNIFVIIIHISLILTTGCVVGKKLFQKNINNISKLMTILLILLLPLVMNICRILTNGMSHTLMIYSLWLIYIFVLVIFNDSKYKKIKIINIALILLVFVGNVRLANTLYMTKEIANEQTKNYLNRVLYHIENYEYYIPGETKVVIIGMPNMKIQFNNSTDQIRRLVGNTNDFALLSSESNRYKLYFERVLHSEVNVIDNSFSNAFELKYIENMPVFPQKDSIKYINDILIVKLG